MGTHSSAEHFGKEAAFSVIALILVALPLPYLLRFDRSHMMTAAIVGLVICASSLYSRRGAVVAAAVYLAFLGDYRRYVGYFEGYPQSDPLLLVGPAVAFFLFCQALMDRRVRMTTSLSKMVALLMLFMFLEIFNPLQGGMQVGFAGALFYLVPLLWFWIGRAYGSRAFMEYFSLRVLVAIGLLATAWGLYQTFFGLFGFERLWVDRIGYGALHISDDVVRAIGFFTSSAEYQRYLIITAITLLAAWLSGRSRLVVFVPIVLLAMFLAAARGPVVMLTGAAVVLWAIKARFSASWAPRFVMAAVLGVTGLVLVLNVLQTASFGKRVDVLVARQVGGLLDPANEEKSTAKGHLQMVGAGIVGGFTAPAGRGLGFTTLAANKYGAQTVNAEIDFPNIMLSLGFLGGLLYAAIVATVLAKAIGWWKAERHRLALITVGIVTITFGGWLIGGEYSTAALVWFYIGALDKLSREESMQRNRSRHSAAGFSHS